jgi:hypothetical protein
MLAAGVTFEAGQLALGPCVHETLCNGYRLAEIVKVALVACWADLAMIAVGVATAILIEPLGVGALLLSIAMTLVPGTVPAAVRARAASELAVDTAAKLYADALATVMGLARRERHVLPVLIDVLGYVRAHDDAERERFARAGLIRSNLDASVERCLKEAICSADRAAFATLAVDESWDGSGPTGLRTERAPLGARIIAVAEAWSALTAKGGPELSHEQALVELEADAGSRFDPAVVEAVAVVVERERRLSAEPAFQPRVHRLPRALQIPVLRVGAQLTA